MCNHVWCGNHTYATPRQLSDPIGGPEGLVWLEHVGEMDWCLCTIDIPETLNRAGLKWEQARNPNIFMVER